MNIKTPQYDCDSVFITREFDVVSYGVFMTLAGKSFLPLSPQFADKVQANEFLAAVSKYIPDAYLMRWDAYFDSADDARRQQVMKEILYPSDGYVLAHRIEQALQIRDMAEALFTQISEQNFKKKPNYAH